jgi:hypothetical protein
MRGTPFSRSRAVRGVCFAIALAVVVAGCGYVAGRPTSAKLVDAACSGALKATDAGRITDGSAVELSGLVASRRHPGVLWAHNDSGDGPRLFAVTNTGQFLASFVLQGVTATDWEDIAIGAGPQSGRDSLYVGDIGDNAAARPQINVVRVPEPDVDVGDPPRSNVSVGSFTNFALKYPDGARDAEALLVDPDTRNVFVVHKNYAGTGVANVYRAPLSNPGTVGTLQQVGTVHLAAGELVTGGEVSPGGDAVVLRTYGRVVLFRRASDTTVAAALGGRACAVPGPAERQGEAVAFSADGRSVYTVSEGTQPVLHRLVPTG